jgi:hypothetical protein
MFDMLSKNCDNFSINVEFASQWRVVAHFSIVISAELPPVFETSFLIISDKNLVRPIVKLGKNLKTSFKEIDGDRRLWMVFIDINLRDVFNSYVNNYKIIYEGRDVFEYVAYVQSDVNYQVGSNLTMPNESGARQVIMISEKGAPLNIELSNLIAANPNWFQKKYHNGVSYKYFDKMELCKLKDGLIFRSDISYMVVVDSSLYKVAVIEIPYLFVNYPCIIYDYRESGFRDFDGVYSSLLSIQDINNKKPSVLQVWSGISSYPDMFFEGGYNSFILLKAGSVVAKLDYLNKIYMETADLLVLSGVKIQKISDVSDDSVSVFMKISNIKSLYFCINDDISIILKNAFKFGLKVKIIYA